MTLRLLIVFAVLLSQLRAETPRETAIALYKQKRFPEAQAAFARIAAANPQNAEACYYLGRIAQRRNETTEAIAQLEKAVALEPNNSDYFLELGGAYGDAAHAAGLLAKMGWAKKCQAALEKAVELNPDSLAARNGLVSYYRSAPSFAGGGMSKAYEQAAEIQRRDPLMGAQVLSQLYIAEKKFDQAFAALEAALQVAPDSYMTLYSIGRTSVQSGLRVEQGEQALRRCLSLTPKKGEPSHAAVHWRIGNLAEKRSDLAAARKAYEASLAADPDFTEAKDALARLK